MRSRTLIAGVGVCAVLALVWWSVREAAAAPEPASHEPGRAAAVPAAPPAPERTPTDEAGMLQLRVATRRGRVVSGSVLWTTSPDPPNASMLEPEGYGLPSGAHQKSHEGSVELRIPAGHWTWLRATDAAYPGHGAYARIAPFDGRRSHTVVLDADARVLHVFVLVPDGTPLANATVRVLATEMETPQAPKPCASARTDAFGYARIEGLAPKGFVVCAPGAEPGDPAPHTARVILPAGMPVLELPVTVVAPAPLRTVRLRVQARLQHPGSLPPRLYLKGQGPLAGRLLPFAGALRDGTQELTLRAPPGDFELGALPLGQIDLSLRQAIYAVPEAEDPTFELAVREAPAATLVQLVGLTQQDFPVSVYPRRTGALHDDDPALLFYGPYHWNLAEQLLPELEGDVLLVASGQRGEWVAERACRIAGPRVDVRMQPASRVSVSWAAPAPLPEAVRCDVQSLLGLEAIALTPRLEGEAGVTRAVLGGVVSVPRGPLRLTCWRGSEVVWTRAVEARAARERIRVP